MFSHGKIYQCYGVDGGYGALELSALMLRDRGFCWIKQLNLLYFYHVCCAIHNHKPELIMRTVTKIILSAFVAFVIGYVLGFYWHIGIPWNQSRALITIITLAGAFGGLLYTARDNGLEFPHRNPDNPHVLNLGWVADCAYGVAGAYVVFLILPTELVPQESLKNSEWIPSFIKHLALALVGGYGGRSIVDRALSNIAKQAEEAKKDAAETKEKLIQIQELDTKALELVHLHLDKSERPQDIQKLKEAIKAASKAARFEIFKEARAVRTANWKHEEDIPLMERTIPIFEALIDSDGGENYHRNHGQLGYALKDKGGMDDARKEWTRAEDELTKAIELRDKEGADGFLMYELNRALCGIKLGRTPASIKQDLNAAAQSEFLHDKMRRIDLINDWAAKNRYDLETMTDIAC